MRDKMNFGRLAALHMAIIVYSLSSVCSKLASAEPFFSFRFYMLYGAVIILLGLYACMWQQILRVLSLSTAFANKAVTTIWGLIWGKLIFQESITFGKIAGAALTVIGVIIFAQEGKENESS